VLATATGAAAVVAEVGPIALLQGLPNAFDYAGRTVPVLRADSLLADLAAWMWGLPRWLRLLADTLVIAFAGTALATLAAVPASFVAARNLAPRPWLSFATRRALEMARGVPELVYALVFVFAFGLGALPGVLAVAVHSVGALGKLFAEAAEAVDAGPIDGVRATGAGWVQAMRFAVLPQVAPAYLSYALLRFEINVRAAAIVGFVGAGGIGMELYLVIRQFIYPDISALVLLLVATVAVIDVACERVRHRVLGGAAA
jgi:phosphonate transport system permease protein